MFNRLVNELAVCSLKTVRALTEVHPETINRLFLREERMQEFAPLCKQLAERKRPYKICADEELERICKTVHHQGIVAMIVEPEVIPLSREDLALWAEQGKRGIVLHSVGNDMNLGAIVRSAAFFDIHFLIISELDEDARLSTGAYRVAEGGMEYVTVRSVRKTELFLRDASKVLLTLGADHRARQRLKNMASIVEAAAQKKGARPGIALVVGNEELGLPDEVKEHCHAILRIPGTGNIESLNVAQAATLFLYELYEA
ncbi:MAG: RNA methyltransferase [Spirochaetaceae bacterium]|jgi:TrmH RNA methyltransferase|nr:RNA methyltransferase [Spirochaetaceae bacterium]